MYNAINEEISIKIISRISTIYKLDIHAKSKKCCFNIKHFYNGITTLLCENIKTCGISTELSLQKGINYIVIYPTNFDDCFNVSLRYINIQLGQSLLPLAVTLKQHYAHNTLHSNKLDFFNNQITKETAELANENILSFSEKIKKYKNILMFCTDYPSYGGASTNCVDLLKYYSADHNTYGIFYTLEDKNIVTENYTVINVKKLKETIENLKFVPDLIMLKNYVPIDLKAYFKCQVYFCVPGIFSEHLDRNYKTLETITEYDYYVDHNVINQIKNCDEIFCNSSHTQDILCSKYGIDSNLFCSGFIKYCSPSGIQPINKSIKFSDRKYDYALIASNLNRKIKNTTTTLNFLKTMKEANKNLNIIIIGKGSNNYIQHGFECCEHLSNDEVINILQNVKYLAQDSYYESCSNIKIESFFNDCVFINCNKTSVV